MSSTPIVGITCSLDEKEAKVRTSYLRAVTRAGGAAVLLPPAIGADDATLELIVRMQLAACDAVVLTGGPDPRTERYGTATHASAEVVHPDRQRYEEALLAALEARREMPVLGICLGMQMMALHAGGVLNQHLADDTPTHAQHLDDRRHEVIAVAGSALPGGSVTSHHHQAVRDPGRLRVIARAEDGVIEAIDDPARRFYVGVQWHPERTSEDSLGLDLFKRMITLAGAARVR